MGSSPEGLTTHAQEPVDPHFPSVKLPKATPRSKAPASGATFSTQPLTVWDRSFVRRSPAMVVILWS